MEIIFLGSAFILFLMSFVPFIIMKKKADRKSINHADLTDVTSDNFQEVIQKLKNEITQLQKTIKKLKAKSSELEKINEDLEKEKELLQKQLVKANELQKQKEELLSIYIHDIKNPAGSIQNMIDLLNSYDLTMQEQKELMKALLTTSEKIVRVTFEISKVIQMEDHSFSLNFKSASLNRVIEDVFSVNLPKLKKKNQQLNVVVDPNLPDVEMDAEKIYDAIDNLLDNAIKFSENNKAIKFCAGKEDGFVKVEVIDEGPGLSEADISRAFQKGARLTAKPTANEHSSGLGLWIVKKIVEDHQGYVWLKSVMGKGSAFGFKIPFKQK